MRNLHELDQFRLAAGKIYGWNGDHTCGAFKLPSPIDKAALLCIASSEGGWDHVSVSRVNRCPNWIEMAHVKRAFFRDDEVAIQFHVAVADHINAHPFCLHLWRDQTQSFPLPPRWMIAPQREEP